MNLWLNEYNIIAKFINDASKTLGKEITNEDVDKLGDSPFKNEMLRQLDIKERRLENIKKAQAARAAKRENDLKRLELFNDIRVRTSFRFATAILTKSMMYCPIDTGALRASAKLKVLGGGFVVSYGGNKAPYAPYVHQIEDRHHKYPTRAKFLEAAVQEVVTETVVLVSELKATFKKSFSEDYKLPIPEIRMSIDDSKVEAFIGVKENKMAEQLKKSKIAERYRKASSIDDMFADDFDTSTFGLFEDIYNDNENDAFYNELFKDVMNKHYGGNKQSEDVSRAFTRFVLRYGVENLDQKFS